jgi:hypothetical protein
MNRGSEREHQGRHDGGGEGEEHDQWVERNAFEPGELRGAEAFERLNRPSRQNQSAAGARKRQGQSFDQQLPDDAAARGAEGAAQRQFRLARAGACEQQVPGLRRPISRR